METRVQRIEAAADTTAEHVGKMREDVAAIKEMAVIMKDAKLIERVSALEAFKKPFMALLAGLTAAAAALTAWIKG
jgi:hypothetical protein